MLTIHEAYAKCKEEHPNVDFYDYANDLGDFFVFFIKSKQNREKLAFNKGRAGFLESLIRATSPSWGIPWIKVNKSTGEVSFYKEPSRLEKSIRIPLDEVIKEYNNSHN